MSGRIGRATLLAAAVIVGGCAVMRGMRGTWDGEAARDVVATYEGRVISRRDVLDRLAELPPSARAAVSTPARKRAFVENMILADLLYEEGKELGLEADPAIASQPERRRRALVVREMMARDREPPAIDDRELRRIYQADAPRYVRNGRLPRYEEIRPIVRGYVTNQRIEAKVREHLDRLKDGMNVLISDDALARLDPLAGVDAKITPPAEIGH
jgi:hypothetical protein